VPKANFFKNDLLLNILVDDFDYLEFQIITGFKTIEKKEILKEI
jgi:hypothetical protein